MSTIIYNKGIPKKILDNIKCGNYSSEEIMKIHKEIKEQYVNRKRGFYLALVITIVCFIFIIVSDLMSSPNLLMSIYTLIILLFIIICCMIYLKKILLINLKISL